MGHTFPSGFDAWCQGPDTAPEGFDAHGNFAEFQRSSNIANSEVAVEHFIRSITREGKRWSGLLLESPSPNHGEWSIQFRQGLNDQVTTATTNIWSLYISGNFKALSILGLTARNIIFQTTMSERPVRFTNCVIGNLALRDMTNQAHRISLELHNCWIGTLQLPANCLKNLNITGGGVLQIDCPPADGANPFNGAVVFDQPFFPISSCQTRLFKGPQAYRSLHAHLKKHDNMLMANQMRSYQTATQAIQAVTFHRVHTTQTRHATGPDPRQTLLRRLITVCTQAGVLWRPRTGGWCVVRRIMRGGCTVGDRKTTDHAMEATRST
jgi:hypothetical protein